MQKITVINGNEAKEAMTEEIEYGYRGRQLLQFYEKHYILCPAELVLPLYVVIPSFNG